MFVSASGAGPVGVYAADGPRHCGRGRELPRPDRHRPQRLRPPDRRRIHGARLFCARLAAVNACSCTSLTDRGLMALASGARWGNQSSISNLPVIIQIMPCRICMPTMHFSGIVKLKPDAVLHHPTQEITV